MVEDRDQERNPYGSAHDRAINRIFGSGLALASILTLPRVDVEVSRRLRDVIDQLDDAVAELRHAALAALVARAETEAPTSLDSMRPAELDEVVYDFGTGAALSSENGHAR